LAPKSNQCNGRYQAGDQESGTNSCANDYPCMGRGMNNAGMYTPHEINNDGYFLDRNGEADQLLETFCTKKTNFRLIIDTCLPELCSIDKLQLSFEPQDFVCCNISHVY